MKPDYQQKKSNLIRAVLDVWQRHGDGLDISIKTSYLNIEVDISDFNGVKILKRERFWIDPQSSTPGSAADLTARALRKMGKEFVTIKEAALECH